jgi:WG containing repeat
MSFNRISIAVFLSFTFASQVASAQDALATELHLVPSNGKFGYIDSNGNTVIRPRFDLAGGYAEGLAPVSMGGRWGYIDPEGLLVIPAKFEDANRFSNGLARVLVNGRWGYIHKNGNIAIPAQFSDASDFSEGLASFEAAGNPLLGYIDTQGRVVIRPRFTYASDFHEGLAVADEYSEDPRVGRGFIDKTGQFVIPPQFENARDFSEGLAAVTTGEKWGFIDRFGKVVIPPIFDRVDVVGFREGLAAVAAGQRWGYVNKTGSFVVQPQFIRAEQFTAGLAAVWTDKAVCHYINKDGTTAFKPALEGNCLGFSPDGVGAHLSAEDSSLIYYSRTGGKIWPRSDSAREDSSLKTAIANAPHEAVAPEANPLERSKKDPNRTTEGVVTGTGLVANFQRVNVGVPCPYVVVDSEPVVRDRTTPGGISTCDYVYEFRQIGKPPMLFLYRGTFPPVTLKELCKIRYSGSTYEVTRSYTIDSLLIIAPKLPKLLNVDEISDADYADFIARLTPSDKLLLRTIGRYKFDPNRKWK